MLPVHYEGFLLLLFNHSVQMLSFEANLQPGKHEMCVVVSEGERLVFMELMWLTFPYKFAVVS